jgi:hypothetical protein
MRVACAAALLAVALSGCGDDAPMSEPRSQPPGAAPSATPADVRAQLPRLTRDLIPDGAFRSVQPGALKVEECGITPTFPCTNVFFAFAEGRGVEARIRALRRIAESNDWRVGRIERFDSGAHVDLVRGDYQARYVIARGLAPVGTSMVQVRVYGPANELPSPSAADRRGWSDAKRRYVRAANAVCARTLKRLVDPSDVAPVLAELEDGLTALRPPPGETAEVRRFLRLLRTLVRSAEALADAEGEDALPAAVGVGEFTKRFVEAASRYGLDECAL